MAKDRPKHLGKLAKNLVKREPVGRSRRRANRIAAGILQRETFITSNHVLTCLENWKFHRNKTRRNVFPSADTDYIWSDTLGLVSTRDSARIVLTKAVLAHPSLFRLLCRWLCTIHLCTLQLVQLSFRGVGHVCGRLSMIWLVPLLQAEHSS